MTATRKVLYNPIQISDNSESKTLTFGTGDDSGKAHTAEEVHGMHKTRKEGRY
jgi:hypothetical protein